MARKGTNKALLASQEAFLAAYAQCGNISRAAKAAGTDRQRHYEWLENEEYAKAFDLAHDEAADMLEAEARRRAVEGTVRKKFQKNGTPITDPATGQQYFELEYSDNLLITLLKATRPDKFKDRVANEHTGKDGAPLFRDISKMSDEELDAELARMETEEARTSARKKKPSTRATGRRG
jgi:hypothetical protein